MLFLKRHFMALLVILVLSLFAVQTFVGEHGLHARSALDARIAGLNKKLQLLHEKRFELERMTKLMAPGAIDRDMLEFQARERLNFVYRNERIYVSETP